jgi:hypothetical protein
VQSLASGVPARASKTENSHARPPLSRSYSASAVSDDVLSKIASLLTDVEQSLERWQQQPSPLQGEMAPLLFGLESRVIAHIDTCFQEQMQLLQKFPQGMPSQLVSKQLPTTVDGDHLRKHHHVQPQCVPEMTGNLALPFDQGNSLDTPLLGRGNDCDNDAGSDMTMEEALANSKSIGMSMDMSKSVNMLNSQARMASLFPDTEKMKRTVLDSLQKVRYDVEKLYHETGCWQKIARSDYFKTFILLIIALNSVWIAIETDHNKAANLLDAPLVFQIVDNGFCFIFTFEVLARFMSFRRKRDAFVDNWFVFDSFLVALMIWETWVMTACSLAFDFSSGKAPGAKNMQILRLVRLIRIFRVARATRLLHGAPELLILARGMVAGMRSVLAVLLMLMLIIYIYGIVFTMTLAGTAPIGAEHFATVPLSMNFLLLQVLCGTEAHFLESLFAVHWSY